jgi:nitroimidazol reductase NimA-like FMN-containing flavoprotein (pyridoxamine 5'-phosphate oxidase superfamily)
MHVMDLGRYRELSPDECRALLRPGGIGHVGVTVSALPAIFPIRFAMLDDDVVFRVAAPGLLESALSGAIVAFAADAIEEHPMRAWSVLVVGASEQITNGRALDLAARLSLPNWGAGQSQSLARISSERISGREYETPESSPNVETRKSGPT